MPISRKVFVLTMPNNCGLAGSRAIGADGVTVINSTQTVGLAPEVFTKPSLVNNFDLFKKSLATLPGMSEIKTGYGWDDVSNAAVILVECLTDYTNVSFKNSAAVVINSDLIFQEPYSVPVDPNVYSAARFSALSVACSSRA